MKGQHVVVLVVLGMLGAVSAGLFGHSLDHLHNEIKKIKVEKLFDFTNTVKSIEVVGLTWSNCGGASDVLKLNSLSVGPDPLRLPGTMQASFDITAGSNVTNPVSVDLDISIKKKLTGWIKVPCLDHKGSCKYDDMCPHSASNSCPTVFTKNGIPCSCPFQQGHYVLPVSNIDVTHISLPSFMKHAEFKARVRVSEGSGAQLMCIDMRFSLA